MAQDYTIRLKGDYSQLLKDLKDLKGVIAEDIGDGISFKFDFKQSKRELNLLIDKIKHIPNAEIQVRYNYAKENAEDLTKKIAEGTRISDFGKVFEKKLKEDGVENARLYARGYIDDIIKEINDGIGTLTGDQVRDKLQEIFDVNQYITTFGNDLSEAVKDQIEVVKYALAGGNAETLEKEIQKLLNFNEAYDKMGADARSAIDDIIQEIMSAFNEIGSSDILADKFEELLNFDGLMEKLNGKPINPVYTRMQVWDLVKGIKEGYNISLKDIYGIAPQSINSETMSEWSKQLADFVRERDEFRRQLIDKGVSDPDATNITFEGIVAAANNAEKAAGTMQKAADDMEKAADKIDKANKKISNTKPLGNFDPSAINEIVVALRELLETIQQMTSVKYDFENVSKSFQDALRTSFSQSGDVVNKREFLSNYLGKTLGITDQSLLKNVATEIINVGMKELDRDLPSFYNDLGKRAVEILTKNQIDAKRLLGIESRSVNLGDTRVTGHTNAVLNTDQLSSFINAVKEVGTATKTVSADAVNIKGLGEEFAKLGETLKVGLNEDAIGNIQKIVTVLQELSDVIQKTTGIMSSSALDKEFEKIQTAAAGLGNTSNIEEIRAVTEQYGKYLMAGGQKAFEEITPDESVRQQIVEAANGMEIFAEAERLASGESRGFSVSLSGIQDIFSNLNVEDGAKEIIGAIKSIVTALNELLSAYRNVNGDSALSIDDLFASIKKSAQESGLNVKKKFEGESARMAEDLYKRYQYYQSRGGTEKLNYKGLNAYWDSYKESIEEANVETEKINDVGVVAANAAKGKLEFADANIKLAESVKESVDGMSGEESGLGKIGDKADEQAERINGIIAQISSLSSRTKEFSSSLTSININTLQQSSIDKYISDFKLLKEEVNKFEDEVGEVPKSISAKMQSLNDSITKSVMGSLNGLSEKMIGAFRGNKYSDSIKQDIFTLGEKLTPVVAEIKNLDTSKMWDIDKAREYLRIVADVSAEFNEIMANANGENIYKNNIITSKDTKALSDLNRQMVSISDDALTLRFKALSEAFKNFDPAKNSISRLRDELKALKADVDAVEKATQKSASEEEKAAKRAAAEVEKRAAAEKKAAEKAAEARLKYSAKRFSDLTKEYQKTLSYEPGKKDVEARKAFVDDYFKSYESIRSELAGKDISAIPQGVVGSLDGALKTIGEMLRTGQDLQKMLSGMNADELDDDLKTALDILTNLLGSFKNQGGNFSAETILGADPDKLRETLEAINTVSSRKFTTAENVRDLLNKATGLRSTSNNADIRDALGDIINELESALKTSDGLNSSFTSMDSSAFDVARAKVAELEGQMNKTGARAGSFFQNVSSQMTSQVAQLFAQYTSIRFMIRYVRQIAQTVTQVDSAITELRKVSGESNTRLQESFKKSAETAQELGATITEVVNSTADWSRLGYSIDQAESLARVTQLLQTVGDNMTQETASKSLISILQGYKIDASQAERTVDSINEVANNFAIDTAGIGDALQRSAAALNAAGTDLNKSIALVTTANAVVQNPETVGTMFKTMSARIRGAKTELADLQEEEDEYTKTTSKLRNLVKQLTGFDIMKDESTFKDIYEIMLGIGKEWKNLTDIEQASLGEALAGKRGANTLYAVLNNLDTLEKSYKTAENAAGSAQREHEAYTQSVQYSIDRMKASAEELSISFMSSDFLKGWVERANSFLQFLTKITDSLGSLGSNIAAIAGIDLIKTLLSGGRNGILGAGIMSFAKAVSGGEDIRGIGEAFKTISVAASKEGKTAGGLIVSSMAKTILANKAILAGSITALVAGIAVVAYSAWKKRQQDLIDSAKSAAEKWTKQRSEVDDRYDEAAKLRNRLDTEDLNDSERIDIKKQIYEIQKQITAEYGVQASGIDLINGKLETQKQIIQSMQQEQARKNLIDNSREYATAIKIATEKNAASVDFQHLLDRDVVSDITKALEDLDIGYAYEEAGGSLGVIIEGTNKQISEKSNELIASLNDIYKKYDDAAKNTLPSLFKDSNGNIDEHAYNNYVKENQYKAETVMALTELVSRNTSKMSDAYKEIESTYKSYLEQQFFANGGSEIAASIEKTVGEIEDAMLSENYEAYESGINNLKNFKKQFDALASNTGWSEQDTNVYWDSLVSGLDTVTQHAFEFKQQLTEALSAKPKTTTAITDVSSKIEETSNEIVESSNKALVAAQNVEDATDILGEYQPSEIEQSLNVLANEVEQREQELSEAAALYEDYKKEFDAIANTYSIADNSYRQAVAASLINVDLDALESDVSKAEEAYKDATDRLNAVKKELSEVVSTPWANEAERDAARSSVLKELGEARGEFEIAEKAYEDAQQKYREAYGKQAAKDKVDSLEHDLDELGIEYDAAASQLKNVEEFYNERAESYQKAREEYARIVGLAGRNPDVIENETTRRSANPSKGLTNVRGKYGTITERREELGLLDEATEKEAEVLEKHHELVEKVADEQDTLSEFINTVKNASIDVVDYDMMMSNLAITTDGAVEPALQRIGKEFGIAFDGTPEDTAKIDALRKVLVDLGVVMDSTANNAEAIAADFKTFRKEVTDTYSSIDSVNATLANAVSGKGLTVEYNSDTGELEGDVGALIKAYKNLEGFHAEDIFVYTANGIKLNREELRRLQAQQTKITRQKFLDEQKKLTQALMIAERNRNSEAKKGAQGNVKKYQDEIDQINKNLTELGYLKAAYEGATSAYQQWLNAQSAGEEGDIYDNMRDTMVKRADELYKSGLVGTEEFRKIAQVLSGEDLTTANIEEVKAAYKSLDASIEGTNQKLRNFFKEGSDGCLDFIDAMVDLGVATKKDGKLFIENLDTEEFAKRLGTSTDIVEALFGKLKDYGIDVKMFTKEQSEQIKEWQKEIQNWEKSWSGGKKLLDRLGFDVKDLDTVEEIDDALTRVTDMINEPHRYNLDDSQVRALNELYDILIEKKGIIETPTTIDVTTVDQFVEYEEALNGVKKEIRQINRSGLDLDLSKDGKEAIEKIAKLPPEVQTALKLEPTDDSKKLLEQLGLKSKRTGGEYQNQAVVKPGLTTPMQTRTRTENTTVNREITDSETRAKITVDDSGVDESKEKWDKAKSDIEQGAYGTITERVEGQEQLDELLKKEAEAAEGAESDVDVSVSGTSKLERLQSWLDMIHDKHINIDIQTTGQSALHQAILDWSGIRDGETKRQYLERIINTHGSTTANGTAHVFGTIQGFAHAGGKWGLPGNQRALINEVGPEIVVRGSNWFIPNGGRPTMGYPLKKGDIIFNAKQSEELLKNGYIARGYAKANGTASGPAHAGVIAGGGLDDLKRGKSDSSKSSEKAAKSSESAAKSSESAAKSNEETAENLKDWVEVLLNRIAKTFEDFKSMADYWTTYINKNRELNNAIDQAFKNIADNQKAYQRYMQEANNVGLSDSYKKKVQSGELNIENIKDEKLREKVEKYQEWYDKALAVKDTIRDLNKEIYELSRQKIDNLIEDYESFNEYTQAAYENASKLNEVYTKRIGRGNKNNLAQMAKQQNNLYVEYAHAYKRIEDEMNAQLANGTMKKNSEAYRKAKTDLVNLKNAMLDVELEIYNINEAIREVNWKNWENALKMLEHVDSQIGSTIDLISDLNNYNEDNARITDAGIAKYDLYSSALANARQKVANLNTAIATLDKEYKEGVINEQEYNEQMQEYRQQQMAAAGEVKKHRDAIISLIKDGIEAETKAMEKLTDARKEALKKQKEADDYARSVSDKTTEINKIRAKIAAMAGDDTMATQAKVAKLREELATKEEDLARTRQDHEYDEMVKSLDDGLEAFKETQDEKTRALSDSLANQEAAIENSLSWTTTQYKTTYDELTEISRSFGIDLEDFLTKPWKSATAAAKTFEEATTKAMKSNAGISTTGYQTIDKNKAADKTGSISAGNSYVESMSNPTTEQKKTNKSKTGGNNATSGKKIAGSFSGASLWFGNTNKVSDVKYLQQLLNAIMGTNMTVDGVFGPKTEAAVKAFQSKYGIGVDGVFGNKSRAKMLEVAKKLGYARRGKRNARGLYITDEQGLGSEAIITKDGVLRQLDSDTVFSKKQTEALWNISKMSLDNAMKVSSRGANVNITYGSLLTVTGDVTKDALPGLEEILKKACEYTKRDITASMSKLGFR